MILRRSHAQEAGIQLLKVRCGRVHALSHQAEIDRVIDLDRVIRYRLHFLKMIQPVLGRVLGHDGYGQNDWNVVSSFLGKHIASIQFPKIGVTGALDGTLDSTRTRVVGSHGQVPVAKLLVEIFQVARSGARGLLRILAVIHPPVALQAVAARPAGHELPDSTSADSRQSERVEARFGLRQVNQILRNALFLQDAANHRVVAARANQRVFERAPAVV